MKKWLLLLLVGTGAYAQEKVYNVQQYCVDEKPFKTGQCDQSGNEYSFVFVDEKKADVGFFFTDIKLKYKIVDSHPDPVNRNVKVYVLQNDKGSCEMKINRERTKIEFLYPDNHIYLTVGKSTKAD